MQDYLLQTLFKSTDLESILSRKYVQYVIYNFYKLSHFILNIFLSTYVAR